MRNKFDEQLEFLNVELIKMGALCEDAIAMSIKALLEDNDALIEKVFVADHEIDQMERDIETLCMRLLLQQQPVARDLRIISAALKMVSDMERIGDQASDIAEISKYIRTVGKIENDDIYEMAKATITMVTNSIDSFVKRDIVLAKQVVESDDIVDALFDKIKKELITMIGNKSIDGEYCIDLLMIAKYFERIGDHATNIAEWVEFSLTGIYKGEPL